LTVDHRQTEEAAVARDGAAARAGALLGALPPLFEAEKPVTFDPVQTALLQGLCRESTLAAKISIRSEDFFRAILFLDYFAEVVAARSTPLEDLEHFTDELEKIDEYLDPDLELVVRYAGLFVVRALGGERFLGPRSLGEVRRRHDKRADRPSDAASAPDLFDLAVGRMLVDLVRTEVLVPLVAGPGAGRNDLRAVLYLDAILSVLGEGGLAGAPADLPGAVLEATASLVRASATFSPADHVAKLRGALRG
jgi:hypothetical protein